MAIPAGVLPDHTATGPAGQMAGEICLYNNIDDRR